ncbi:MAG: 6-pyruvoyl-tetrahydropterin synthase-related protein, partial [Candidatus Margulisbacteria bacterium]|nr:6-pyruvoyl-tetrahydropterin synthase-related protein [Candidatus Margulisiibacteriota bacterium]
FGLAMVIVFFCTLYRGIEEKNRIILNSVLLLLIGLSHGYTLIFSGVIASFFLFTRKSWRENLVYLVKVYSLGVSLLAFWLLPFFMNVPYVTSYVTRWQIASIFEVIPLILAPFFAASLAAFMLNLFDRRTLYFGYIILACLLIYILSPSLGMLDIRWVPFVQLFMTIFGATIVLMFIKNIKGLPLVPIILFLVVVLWVSLNVTFIKGWIKWNYEGFENKAAWPLLQKITGHLSKTDAGRVVYEHSPAHNVFGSERVFENLPYLAKRKTLEGLYMQSSISAPFVFYIQSEISKVCSGPFPQYKYASLNLPAAIPHLKMFNVTQYIVRSPEAKKQAQSMPELKLEQRFDDYEIYRLTSNDGHYVVPLAFQPVLYKTNNWKMDFFDWFRNIDINDIHLVYLKSPGRKDQERFQLQASALTELKRVPIKSPPPAIKETIKDEEIIFHTNLVGYPHLIKVSYHPNWKVEGAERIYLVSPSFMLVYPEKNTVRLYFGKTLYNYLGELLSLLGLSIILVSGIIYFIHVRKT